MNRYKKIIDIVDDGYNYFSYRLEEVKTDDRFYIKAFMSYIELLESRTKELQEENSSIRKSFNVNK